MWEEKKEVLQVRDAQSLFLCTVFNQSLVSMVAAQCLPYGNQRMRTPLQPIVIVLVS